MRSIDMQYQQQVRCRYNMGDMLCMSRMISAHVGMLAHFVLGRAMEGKSRQDKTRQDKKLQRKKFTDLTVLWHQKDQKSMLNSEI